MSEYRYRLFRGGEYIATGSTPNPESVPNFRSGDIIYVQDRFMEMVEGTICQLDADDPKVQGLYGKAVVAERSAAFQRGRLDLPDA
jgi:hypothetical protein